jgi:hypothetical protein
LNVCFVYSLLKGHMMRILCSAVILAVALGVGCGEKSKAATTTPPAQAAPAAAAPAPAPAPAGRAAGAAPAAAPAGRQGGRGGAAPVTIEQHAAAMKQIGQAVPAAGKALKGGDTATATTNVEIVATQFATIETFYTQRMKPDAVKLAQTARTGAADTLAALKAGDAMKAQMSLANTQGTCKQCHGMYREGDAQTGYKFNAASGITAP